MFFFTFIVLLATVVSGLFAKHCDKAKQKADCVKDLFFYHRWYCVFFGFFVGNLIGSVVLIEVLISRNL